MTKRTQAEIKDNIKEVKRSIEKLSKEEYSKGKRYLISEINTLNKRLKNLYIELEKAKNRDREINT